MPPQGSSALAGAILQMLGDPALAERGRNGRAYVSAEFNFQRMIEKTDRMYTELLHSQGAE